MNHTRCSPHVGRHLFSSAIVVLLATLLLSPAPGVAGAAEPISLAGMWRFRLDPDKVGVDQKWFDSRLPGEIRLPGTTDEAKLGLPNKAKPSLDGLYRPNVYVGPAWYQREIDIPAAWQGKHVSLLLERVHWQVRAWLDGREIGTQNSLTAPQTHELGSKVAPGKHTLTLRADNTPAVRPGRVRIDSLRRDADQLEWHCWQDRTAGGRPSVYR
jgi:hypothetical protein